MRVVGQMNPALSDSIRASIRSVPDYPKPGIVFKDITPLLSNAELMRDTAAALVGAFQEMSVDAVAAIEARGFIFGSLLAHEKGCAFLPLRKPGKLPHETRSQEVELEYGTTSIEIHVDAVRYGWKVIVHDDLLATGGTAAAAGSLIQALGGIVVGFSFLINLSFLPGEQRLLKQFGIQPRYLVSY